MTLHCPCCHAQFSIEAITQDEAARELLVLVGSQHAAPLLGYLALFRSEKRALSWERALRLAKEVVALDGDNRAIHESPLREAMVETIEALRGKGGAPLKNHNYLKRVLESQVGVDGRGTACRALTDNRSRTAALPSKTSEAMQSLEEWKRG